MSAALKNIIKSIKKQPDKRDLLIKRFVALASQVGDDVIQQDWLNKLASSLSSEFPQDAIKICRQAYGLNRQNPETLHIMQQSFLQLGLVDEAELIRLRIMRMNSADFGNPHEEATEQLLTATEPMDTQPVASALTSSTKIAAEHTRDLDPTTILETAPQHMNRTDVNELLATIVEPDAWLPESLVDKVHEICQQQISWKVSKWLLEHQLHTSHPSYFALFLEGVVNARMYYYAYLQTKSCVPRLGEASQTDEIYRQVVEICQHLGYRAPTQNLPLTQWVKDRPCLSFSSSLWTR